MTTVAEAFELLRPADIRARGFVVKLREAPDSRNLFRMRQFFEAYRANEKLSPLVTQLPWTHHVIILSQARPVEAREHYILAAIDQRWSKRELERRIQTGAVLRSASALKKVPPALWAAGTGATLEAGPMTTLRANRRGAVIGERKMPVDGKNEP